MAIAAATATDAATATATAMGSGYRYLLLPVRQRRPLRRWRASSPSRAAIDGDDLAAVQDAVARLEVSAQRIGEAIYAAAEPVPRAEYRDGDPCARATRASAGAHRSCVIHAWMSCNPASSRIFEPSAGMPERASRERMRSSSSLSSGLPAAITAPIAVR
jgi:hypothetical protein